MQTCLRLPALAFLLVTGVCAGAGESVVPGNTAFALDLYAQLRAGEGNLFYAPYSVSTALAMTYGGARGETEKQMARTLHFGPGQERLHPAFAALAADLAAVQKKGKVKLSVANALWPQQDYRFLPAYLDLCKTHYGTTVTPLDYVRAAEPARQTINTWVEAQTNRKITNLIPPGVLDALTRLVLVNAIYFKGDWAAPFKPALTQSAPFRLASTKTVQARLMTRQDEFGYGEVPGLQILELPYAGNDLSMLVLLPRTDGGLPALEKALTVETLAAWSSSLRRRDVQVLFPKFKLTAQFSLGHALAALGMPDAFAAGKADFSGMDGSRELFIGAVIHKAFVEVNEEGTEAAAATAVVMMATSMREPEPVPVFRADHPFLFLIRENRSGSILFCGRLADPTA